MMKNTNGEQVPFEIDGVERIDGSVQADLPFEWEHAFTSCSLFVSVLLGDEWYNTPAAFGEI